MEHKGGFALQYKPCVGCYTAALDLLYKLLLQNYAPQKCM